MMRHYEWMAMILLMAAGPAVCAQGGPEASYQGDVDTDDPAEDQVTEPL